MKQRLAIGLVVAAALAIAPTIASGPQSFTFLQAGFTQELYGTSANFIDTTNGLLGGVAFRLNDPVVAECLFSGTRLHQFDSSTAGPIVGGTASLHPETVRSFDADVRGFGGCGLTNHPNGFVYANLDASNGAGQPGAGIAEIDPITWTVARYFGPAGSALGIAVDPQSSHLVYVGQDCEQGGTSPTCTLFDADPVSGTAHVFMQVPSTTLGFVDGVYFDPTGSFVFLSARAPATTMTVLQASGPAASRTAVVIQQVPMTSEPDGVAFHADAPKFVVTNNNDGTMSRFDFSGDDYTKAPTTSVFASGGFRGDLTQVGPDGCIYATQLGTRYDDGTATGDNSVVRICGGFAPPPGVAPTPPSCTGTIGDFVWFDANGDGVQQSGEPGIGGVTLTLRSAADGSVLATTTSDAGGAYSFANQCAGTYTVSAATPSGYAPTTSLVGSDRSVDSNGSPTTVVLTTSKSVDTTIDFGFVLGTVSGTVYLDQNRNGVRDAGEPGLGGVAVTLTGPTGGTVTTAADGTYRFALLPGGAYQAQAPSVASGWAIETTNPFPVALAAGQNRTGVDFGYVGGTISGFAYVDANRNGARDSGEAGIGGVTISL
ncbi:MAG TPA: SdrD B-like domain-containing protein, partial [Vicinamibacterales bacterium]|nr:SdrD B-like domain-containing protein [Vicinamibacterales bacterium]